MLSEQEWHEHLRKLEEAMEEALFEEGFEPDDSDPYNDGHLEHNEYLDG